MVQSTLIKGSTIGFWSPSWTQHHGAITAKRRSLGAVG